MVKKGDFVGGKGGYLYRSVIVLFKCTLGK